MPAIGTKPKPAKPRSPRKAPPLHPAEQYIADVMAGRIVVCKWVRLAVERHVKDLADGHERGLHFDRAAAEHVIEFFGFLRHYKGEWAGKPFTLAPWQQFILWCLFGWKKADGNRRFTTAYVEVARKNGKSTLAAGVGLYLFSMDGEPGAEVYTAATKLDQARIVHRDAVNMVRKSPDLSEFVEIFRDNLSIVETASRFLPLGGDSKTDDGLNPHGGIVDELHAHPNGGVYQILDTALGARRQPMIFVITTAGNDETSFCYSKRIYVTQVLESVSLDDSMFGIIFTLDEGDSWEDESTWIKSNPNLDVSVKRDFLKSQAVKAKNVISERNSIIQKHFNLWVRGAILWLPVEKWDACAEMPSLESLNGMECVGGLDLANSLDLAAFALLFALSNDEYAMLPRFWVPEDRLQERERRNQTRLDPWVEAGFITTTPGDETDYDTVRRDINEMCGPYRVREIAFDPWNAKQFSQNLAADGFNVLEFTQSSLNFTEPCKKLEQLVLAGKLRHGGHPVLRWMASNVVLYVNGAGNMMPARKKCVDKIDGIVALLMALGRYIVVPAEGDAGCEAW